MLTAGKRACGDIRQRLQGRVGLERLGNVLGALCTDLVVPDAASESRKKTKEDVRGC